MRTLFILRHAQSPSAYDMADHDRPIDEHGIAQAQFIARHLPSIDIALCSTARRVQMTFEEIEKSGVVIKKSLHEEELYNASASVLLNTIQHCHEEKTVLIIAHNPGIQQLANVLVKEEGGKFQDSILHGYSSATLSVYECPISNWNDLNPAENKLINLIIPD